MPLVRVQHNNYAVSIILVLVVGILLSFTNKVTVTECIGFFFFEDAAALLT